MSGLTGIILFLTAIILAVIIGTKTKCNIGIVGICFAFLIGTILMGKSIAEVISYFPTSLLFTMMIVTFFYGYSAHNGAIRNISNRMIYICRNHVNLLPVVLYVSVFLVSTMGAGAGAAPVIMSPIAFALSAQLGFDPVLAVLAVSLGSLAGGIQAWTSSGVMFKGIAEPTLGDAVASSVSWAYGATLFIVPTLFFLIVFLVLSRKQKAGNHIIEEVQPLNREQRLSLILIAVLMVMVIIPVFANMFFPNPITRWFASKFDIKVLCAFGIVLCAGLKLGNTAEIIKNNIPWSTILMVCGMSMMINMSVETGIADLMGSWLGNNIPVFLVVPLIILLGGLLSFVTTGPAVIFPLFIPMFPMLAQTTGISVVVLTTALFAGTGATGMSPFSQGGAMAITGCKDDSIRESLWSKQLLFAFLFLTFYLLAGLLGVFNLVASVFS